MFVVGARSWLAPRRGGCRATPQEGDPSIDVQTVGWETD